MRIPGAATDAGYLWVESLQAPGKWKASLPYFFKTFSAIFLPVARPHVLPLGLRRRASTKTLNAG